MNPLAHLWAGGMTVAAPGLRLLLHRRARRGKELPARLAERRGIPGRARPPGLLIWLHAASVGEALSLLDVLACLATRAPDGHVLLSTGTVTSAALLAERLPAIGLADRVIHQFAPLDVPRWVARFLDHWRPDAAGLVESELWPNLIAACRRRGIPLALVNARLSPRSHAAWRRVPGLARAMLAALGPVLAQSAADADRLRTLGARDVRVLGNLKFAAAPLPVAEAELSHWRAVLAGRPVWLAASTHPGEEEAAFQVHRALAPRFPGLLSIIVPRHPERGAAIARLAGGIPVARRAEGAAPPAEGVWIGDTLGELGLFYRLAQAAFIGRSLFPPGGGQNPLEAARLGCAAAAGPFMDNFQEAATVLRRAGGLRLVDDVDALTKWVGDMLGDPVRRDDMAMAGRAACAAATDLPDRVAEMLLSLAGSATGRAA